MKMTTVYAIIWMSVAVGVSVAVVVTKSATPLWAFAIPAYMSFTDSD